MLRILLDAHVSGGAIAKALRSDGHDVMAIAEDTSLEGLDDPLVLELAARERRILVTHDVKDFAPLLRMWAEAGRAHAGCVTVHGLRYDEFGRVLRAIKRMFTEIAEQADWTDVAIFLSPATTEAPPNAH